MNALTNKPYSRISLLILSTVLLIVMGLLFTGCAMPFSLNDEPVPTSSGSTTQGFSPTKEELPEGFYRVRPDGNSGEAGDTDNPGSEYIEPVKPIESVKYSYLTFYIPSEKTIDIYQEGVRFFAKGIQRNGTELIDVPATYSVGNPEVLDVLPDGTIVTKKPGTTEITINAASEAKTISLTVRSNYFYAAETGDLNGLTARQEEVFHQVQMTLDDLITPNMTDYDKIKAVHDYIVLNTTYDKEGAFSDNVPERSFSVEGVMVDHLAVCQGYSDTFKLFMILLDIPCYSVTGTAQGISHIWNIVKLDGISYQIDVTFDDPIFEGDSDPNYIGYDFFLVPDSFMRATHTYEISDYPFCTATYYTYYRFKDNIIDSIDSFERKFIELYAKNPNEVIILYPEREFPDPELIARNNGYCSFRWILQEDGSLPVFGDYTVCSILH